MCQGPSECSEFYVHEFQPQVTPLPIVVLSPQAVRLLRLGGGGGRGGVCCVLEGGDSSDITGGG